MLDLVSIARSIRKQFDETELKSALQTLELDYEAIVPSSLNYEDGSIHLLNWLNRRGWLKKVFAQLRSDRPDVEAFVELMTESLKALAEQGTTLADVLGPKRASTLFDIADAVAGFFEKHNTIPVGIGVTIAIAIAAVLIFSDDMLEVKTLDHQSRPIDSVDLTYFLKNKPNARVSALATKRPDDDFFRIPINKLAEGIPIGLELTSSGPGERATATFQVEQLRYETSRWRFWGDTNKLFLTIRVRSAERSN